MRVLVLEGGKVANLVLRDDGIDLSENERDATDYPAARIGDPVVNGDPVSQPSPFHRWSDGVWVEDLDEAKASAVLAMLRWIDRLTSQLRAGYAQDEVASWTQKAIEARALLVGEPAGPMLTAEAELRGWPLEDLALSVVGHADRYAEIMGSVAGIRSSTHAAIHEATSAEGVRLALESAKVTASQAAALLGLVVESPVE